MIKKLLSKSGITILIITSFLAMLLLNILVFVNMNRNEKALKSDYFHQIELLAVYWQNIFSGDELEFITEGMEFDNVPIYYQNLLIQLKNDLPITEIKILNRHSRIIVDTDPLYQIGIPFAVDSTRWAEVTRKPAQVHIYTDNNRQPGHIIVFLPLTNSLDKITAVLYINTVPDFLNQLNIFRKYTSGYVLLALLLTIGFGFFILYLFHQYSRLLEQESQRQRLAQIGEMASTIAHEIRNPLGIIKGSASLLKKQITDAPSEKMISFITEEINRLNELINRMLKYVKTPELHPEKVDIISLIEEQLAFIRNEHENIGITLHAANSVFVLVDSNAMKQIIINILNNSIQALEQLPVSNEKRIDIHIKPEGKNVAISIYNNGPHIPGDVLSKIFQPFFTTRETGSGLGLPLSKSLIEYMGGEISLENAPEEKGVVTRLIVRKFKS